MDRGIDLSLHKSRIVTPQLMNEYQLILTMEHGHKEALLVEFRELNKHIFLLSEMVGSKFGINDPMGKSKVEFIEIADEIASILQKGFEKIKSFAYS